MRLDRLEFLLMMNKPNKFSSFVRCHYDSLAMALSVGLMRTEILGCIENCGYVVSRGTLSVTMSRIKAERLRNTHKN